MYSDVLKMEHKPGQKLSVAWWQLHYKSMKLWFSDCHFLHSSGLFKPCQKLWSKYRFRKLSVLIVKLHWTF
jgi:hypothetical protein